MPKFPLYEKAKLKVPLCNPVRPIIPAGTEVIIIGLPGSYKGPALITKKRAVSYMIEANGFDTSCGALALEENLEKLVGSWDDIEKLTGFKPRKRDNALPSPTQRIPETVPSD